MKFEWDEKKNRLNIEKHGLDFIDAKKLFNNSIWEFRDERNNYGETRMVAFGYLKGRLLNLVYTIRKPNIIRIISFRKANTREEALYEKNFKN